MEFEIGRDELTQELALCDSIVQPRSTMPILSMMLISADAGMLSMAATDCETTIQSDIECKVNSPGSFCFPSKRLSDYISSLPTTAHVKVSCSNTWATITSGNSSAKIPLLEPSEFPKFPTATEKVVAVQCSELSEALRGVLFSVSEDIGDMGSKEVCIDANHALSFVTMDHSRMPFASIKVACAKEIRMLLGKRSANALARVAANSAGSMDVFANDRCATFIMGNRAVTAQMVARSFPSYAPGLEKTYPHRAKLRAPDLRSALERAMLFIDPRLPSVSIDFGSHDKGVSVATKEGNAGSGRDGFPYISTDGEPMKAFFNPYFVMDFLRYAKDRDVDFLYTDRKGTCEFRISGIDTYRYFCMPKEF